jgi:hypothetical protein
LAKQRLGFRESIDLQNGSKLYPILKHLVVAAAAMEFSVKKKIRPRHSAVPPHSSLDSTTSESSPTRVPWATSHSQSSQCPQPPLSEYQQSLETAHEYQT